MGLLTGGTWHCPCSGISLLPERTAHDIDIVLLVGCHESGTTDYPGNCSVQYRHVGKGLQEAVKSLQMLK